MTEQKTPGEAALDLLREYDINPDEFFLDGTTENSYVALYRDEQGEPVVLTLEHDGLPYKVYGRIPRPWPEGFPYTQWRRLVEEAGFVA